MLLLGQQVGQEITVEHGGEKLVITLIRAKGSNARIGFTGPESFEVTRDDMKKVKPYNAVDDE